MTGPSRTVLVADDNPLERKLLGIRLTQVGFQVLTAEDGVEALEKARSSPPDAIVADVVMPRLDGFRLCQALRRDPQLAGLPVVLTSAASIEESDRVLARNLGANAYVQRTPGCQEIIEALQKSLAEQAPPPLPDNDALVAELREKFLASGEEESRALLQELASQFDPASGRQLAHRWAGVGGTLGLPQISQRAYEIERLFELAGQVGLDAQEPPAKVAHRLRTELEEIARLFSDAPRGKQDIAPPLEVVEGLRGKRIALLGFGPADSARMSQGLWQAQASVQVLPVSATPPGSPVLAEYDLVVLLLSPETERSLWSDAEAVTRNERPLLVVGPRDLLLDKAATIRERAADFLVSPWRSEEAVLRACRVLTKGQANIHPTPTLGEGIRVVVADDDLTIGALVAATLQRHGIQCRIARHGVQALEMTRSLHPNALVLDIMMPQLDGFEVLAALKADPETCHIPVLLLTVRRQEADIVRGFELGAEDYVVKPFNPMELVARVKRLLRIGIRWPEASSLSRVAKQSG